MFPPGLEALPYHWHWERIAQQGCAAESPAGSAFVRGCGWHLESENECGTFREDARPVRFCMTRA
eukprot:9502177-Pyramimonas_sp.AAC.1